MLAQLNDKRASSQEMLAINKGMFLIIYNLLQGQTSVRNGAFDDFSW